MASAQKHASVTCRIETGGFLVDIGGTNDCVVMVTFPDPGAVMGLDGELQVPCGIERNTKA